jgi:hypothetical protein
MPTAVRVTTGPQFSTDRLVMTQLEYRSIDPISPRPLRCAPHRGPMFGTTLARSCVDTLISPRCFRENALVRFYTLTATDPITWLGVFPVLFPVLGSRSEGVTSPDR